MDPRCQSEKKRQAIRVADELQHTARLRYLSTYYNNSAEFIPIADALGWTYIADMFRVWNIERRILGF